MVMTLARLGHDEGMVDPYLMEGRKKRTSLECPAAPSDWRRSNALVFPPSHSGSPRTRETHPRPR